MAPFVLIVFFLIVIAFTINLMGQLQTSAQMVRDVNDVESVFGLTEFAYIDPKPPTGRVITAVNVSDHVVYPTDNGINENFHFTDADSDPGSPDIKYVQIIRDNRDYKEGSDNIWEKYQDFIAVRRNKDHPGSTPYPGEGTTWMNAAIPYSAFAGNYDNKTNVSFVYFMLGDSNDTLFIKTGPDFLTNLWADNYTMFYGWSFFRTHSVNMWGSINLIMFHKIPGVNPIFDFFIKAFIFTTSTFVIFTMVSRFIPGAGGG